MLLQNYCVPPKTLHSLAKASKYNFSSHLIIFQSCKVCEHKVSLGERTSFMSKCIYVVRKSVGQQGDEVCGIAQQGLGDIGLHTVRFLFSSRTGAYMCMYVNIQRFVASAALTRKHQGLSERITLLPTTSPMQRGFRNDFLTLPAH